MRRPRFFIFRVPPKKTARTATTHEARTTVAKKHCTEHRPQQHHVIIWSDAPTPKARKTFSAQTEISTRNRRTASEETVEDTVVLSNSEFLTKGIELAVRALFPPVVSHSMSATSGARPAKGTTT